MPGLRRQVHRHRYPSPPTRPPAARQAAGHSRWWNRATKSIVTAIVTLGAVAGAVSTVVSLWPSPDADDSAEVTVRIIPGIPLSEYQHRMESTGTISLKGYNPADDEPTPEPTADAGPSETTSPVRTTTTPDPTETPTSTDPTPDPTAEPWRVPTAEPTSTFDPGPSTGRIGGPQRTTSPEPSSDVAVGQDDSADSENFNAIGQAYQDLTGGDSIPSEFIAIGNAVTPSGDPVEPAVAAERIAKVLTDARHAPSAADPAIPDPEPLGVVVSTDLDLSGLRGEALTLSWSMWQEAGGVRLNGDWLNDNLAYRIEPRTDHATTTLDVWIPMPREPGPTSSAWTSATAGPGWTAGRASASSRNVHGRGTDGAPAVEPTVNSCSC